MPSSNYRLHRLDALLILEWTGTPTVPALDGLAADLDAILAVGASVAFITLIREGTVAPDAVARDRMNALFESRLPRFRAHCLVIEGEGLAADAKRLFTRAALALMGQSSPLFGSLPAALQSPPYASFPAGAVMQALATVRGST